MSEDELFIIVTKHRKEIRKKIVEFFNKNESVMNDELIMVASTAIISSLITDFVYELFKKDIGFKNHYKYIDEVCQISKEYLKDVKEIINKNISVKIN